MSEIEAPVVSDVIEAASQVRFFETLGKGIVMAVLFVFTAIGWVFGSIWFVAVFTALWVYKALGYGFTKGAHTKPKPKRRPSVPQ